MAHDNAASPINPKFELQIQPREFEDRILFISVRNNIDWTAKDNVSRCGENSSQVSDYALKFLTGHWTFLGPGEEDKPYGDWNSTTEKMMVKLRRECALGVPRNEFFVQRVHEKQRRQKIRCTFERNLTQQNCGFVQCLRSISSKESEQWRIVQRPPLSSNSTSDSRGNSSTSSSRTCIKLYQTSNFGSNGARRLGAET